MGNKIPQRGPYTPKPNRTINFLSPQRSQTPKINRDSLFAEDKLFENYDSNIILFYFEILLYSE